MKNNLKKLKQVFVHALKKNWAMILIISVFLLQSYYLSFQLGFPAVPDEGYHLLYSIIQSNDLLEPILYDSHLVWVETESMVRAPFLYHYLNGILIELNILNIPTLFLLRIINPLYGALNLVLIFKIAKKLFGSTKAGLLSSLIMSQVLMFVFLSSGINYDNLTILLSLLTFLSIINFQISPSLTSLLKLIVILLLGSITKISFLPLILLSIFAIIFIAIKEKLINKKFVQDQLLKLKYLHNKILLTIVIALGIFSFSIYGMNYLQYSTLDVKCQDLIGHEKCLASNAIYRRSYEAKANSKGNAELGPSEAKEWADTLYRRSFGVVGHRRVAHYHQTHLDLYKYLFISLIISSLIFYKKFKYRDILILFMAVSYMMILFFIHASAYTKIGEWNALQGRYTFLVLPIIFIIISMPAKKIHNKIFYPLFILLLIISSYTGFINLIQNIPEISQNGSEFLNEEKLNNYLEFTK